MVRLLNDLEKELSGIKPAWQQDGFKTYSDYQKHYVDFVEDKVKESQTYWRPVRTRWKEADKRLDDDGGTLALGMRGSEAQTDLPMVPQAVEESISVLVETLPRPTASPRQATQDDFVGALNYFMEVELDANDFDLLMARVALDIKRFNLGIVKQTIDRTGRGPFGQPGRIVMTHVDPRNCHFDPHARGFRWGDYRYLVVEQVMDLSDVKLLWDRGNQVKADATYSRDENSPNIDSPRMMETAFSDDIERVGKRERVVVKEMWLKDDRRKFKPELDEEGAERKDMNGDVIGQWEPMYPHGRLIIVAGEIVLADMPNPFRHQQPPYSFFPGRVQGKLLGVGDVHILGRIEDKINRLHKSMYANALVNMNSPWIIDRNAFDSPSKFKNITQQPGLVLPVQPGAKAQRLNPAEIPAFIPPFIDWLKDSFDDVLGIREINRGGLAKGAQLSTEAIGALQGAASSRIRLKSRLIENSLKHMGHLLQWNIREYYPSQMVVEMTDPSSQEPKKLYWNDDEAQPDYAISIEAGSSLPGSKQSMMQLAVTLWREGLIGRRRALGMMDLPGADAISKEREDEIMKIAAVNLQEAMKRGGYDNVARGRKPQQVKV